MQVIACVVLLAVAAAGSEQEQEGPRLLVATPEGRLRGVRDSSAAGVAFYSFKGIPYAKPPLGPLRFQPSQRHPGWEGVVDASAHGSHCLQFNAFNNDTLEGDENCLFANVYTPRLPSLEAEAGGLPVMVYIHGGGFTTGDGDESFLGPKYFMDGEVVLVTFNYRVGPFGFFTTHDSNAPGNYGLLDQVLLLKWVQDNIASFGGDPDAVTIFGQSAGGASVSLLVLSPLTKGLFHHAISQSGASIASWAASARRKGLAQKFAKYLNCSTDTILEMVDCIRMVDPADLMDVAKALDASQNKFIPRVDSESRSPFLPEDPRKLLETGDFNLVPWMSGVTEEEGAFFIPGVSKKQKFVRGLFSGNLALWSLFADVAGASESRILDCGVKALEVAAEVYAFYVGNGTVGYDNLLPLARVITDRAFTAPASEEMRLASAHTPVYKYVLDHKGPGRLSIADVLGIKSPDLGVTHVDDLLYLFNDDIQPIPPADSPTYTMIRFMVSLWTSFARTGRPSSTVLPMPDWPIFNERSQRHMRLNSQPTVGERLFEERVQFWQSMPINEPWRHAVDRSTCNDSPTVREGDKNESLPCSICPTVLQLF